jgi:two-component system, NtrC family, nitrogen regulation sensor histidine kinase NtrY
LTKRRLLYGSGAVALALLVTLVVWQGSFTFGDYSPANPAQTLLYWAVSSLVFILTLTLAFILFRTAVNLYIERRSGREGSRIRTKLVIGALALSFLPVFFLVLWSVYVLNRNLDKWFSRPAEGIKLNLVEIVEAIEREAQARVKAQAELLAASPEIRAIDGQATGAPAPPRGFFERFCREHGMETAVLEHRDGTKTPLCEGRAESSESVLVASVPAGDGRLVVAAPKPVDLVRKRNEIQGYLDAYDQLALDRRSARNFYLQLLFLLTLFLLFLATWIALFLARQISVPISALLDAAGEVRKGNLGYRLQVRAVDELATLVRGFNEMTEALEANRRELESRRRFTEAILESIPTGVISLAPDGRILRVNSALKQIFPEERVARAERLEDLFSREDTADIKYMMKRARRTGFASNQMELSTGRGMLHLSVTVSALEAKITSGFVLVLEDMSELLRAQKAAAWQEVARRIAHEVKNPLTPITLSAERVSRQIERSQIPAETARIVGECTATIVQEAESLKRLLDEFSQFARFPTAQPAPADLNEVVESAMGVFAGRLEGIDVRKELAANLPPVHIDREQFRRVVTNLVDNSAEAMQDSPVKRLYVATHGTAPDAVELVVADTGCGISPEEREKLFLPTFSTKGRGTGLGLAIVSRILADHNAHIRVEDNHPAGARFIIEIPAHAPNEADSSPAEVRA